MENVDISVIIPNVNSPLIGTTLDSLKEQQTTHSYEVIVIGRDDSGICQKRDDIQFIETETPLSAGANRNIGIKASKGRFIMFTDADCHVLPDWIEVMTTRLTAGYKMVGGAFDFPKTNYWVTGDNMAILHNLSPETPGGEVDNRVGGGNMGMWKDVLVELGGFDETFRGGQDNDLAIKLLNAGHKIYFEPKSVVDHLPNEGTFKWLCRHAGIYGRASVALIARHPAYYRWETRKKLWRFPWLFLAWTPFKAAQQATRVFWGNPSWRKYAYVWPAIWVFYFLRRVAIAGSVKTLLENKEL